MTISAGKLSDRFAFDRRTAVPDGAGNFHATWTQVLGPLSAQLIYLKGGEDVLAQRLGGVKPAVLVIRDSTAARAITTDWRARDTRRGTVYNITDVTPSQRRGHIDLLLQSGVAHG